jgi:hypothetical protein
MSCVDEEWLNFINNRADDSSSVENVHSDIPTPSGIHISTKTKISYLNQPMDIKNVFWGIPIMPYATPKEGAIKKQMKQVSLTAEELQENQLHLVGCEAFVDEHIITSINNPEGRVKFKDVRKISIGISKKDLLSYRCKKKSAFYNCFVLIFRLDNGGVFKEFHVKVFNTGKLEMPGVQDEGLFHRALKLLLETLQPLVAEKLYYKENSVETVLINSNFKCGFFINREELYDILRYKYNIQAIYDPCSYPGIQCKFYYNPDIGIQTGSQISELNRAVYKNISEVSFMIFRTGSVLIVGKCEEEVLFVIYDFLKGILVAEYGKICLRNTVESDTIVKPKKDKMYKKWITVSVDS